MLQGPGGVRVREQDATRTVIHVSAAYQVRRTNDGETTTTRMLVDERGVAAEITTTGDDTRIHYLRRAHKGSNTHAFDPAGALVWQLAYDGYGRPVPITGTATGPSYEQREWDAELGLFYFGARYYDPVTGRFLTPDSEVGTRDFLQPDALNRFAFELNNPINSIDPTGHSSAWIYGLVAGLVMIGAGVLIAATGGAALTLVFGLGAVGATAAGAAATVVGGNLLGGGLSGVSYSVSHKDVSGGRFVGGFFANVAVGAFIGAVTSGVSIGVGYAFNAASSAALTAIARLTVNQVALRAAAIVSNIARVGTYAVAGAVLSASGDALGQFLGNAIDRGTLDDDTIGYGSGVWQAALIGAAFGTVAGVAEAGAETLLGRINGNPGRPGPANENTALSTTTRAVEPTTSQIARKVLTESAVMFGIATASASIDTTIVTAAY